MNRQHASQFLALAGLLLAAACSQAGSSSAVATSSGEASAAKAPQPAAALPANHPPIDGAGAAETVRGKVLETMNTAGYTYVRVQPAQGKELWAASTEFPVKVGDEVVVDTAMPMENYESTSLNRKFDVVYFAEAIQVLGAGGQAMPPAAGQGMTQGSLLRQVAGQPVPAAPLAAPPGHGGSPAVPANAVDLKGIEKAPGGLTVAEVVEQAESLSGRDVAFRGKVVKFTARVMGKNWLHVRDGSGADGAADITVTTDADAAIGDLVLVKGKVGTKQDFGSGYSYAVIVQDATIER